MAIQTSRRRTGLVLIGLVTALVAACRGGNPNPSPPKNAEPLTAEFIEKLYKSKCSLCHGNDGKMNYAGAKDLSTSVLTKEEVAAQIRYGKGSMPPHKDLMTDEEIEALAAYTIALRGK